MGSSLVAGRKRVPRPAAGITHGRESTAAHCRPSGRSRAPRYPCAIWLTRGRSSSKRSAMPLMPPVWTPGSRSWWSARHGPSSATGPHPRRSDWPGCYAGRLPRSPPSWQRTSRRRKVPRVRSWTVTPPGYVNAHLEETRVDRGGARGAATELEATGTLDLPTDAAVASGKTLVEHTATNPNKAAHIGHLRNACIGDTVARVLRTHRPHGGGEQLHRRHRRPGRRCRGGHSRARSRTDAGRAVRPVLLARVHRRVGAVRDASRRCSSDDAPCCARSRKAATRRRIRQGSRATDRQRTPRDDASFRHRL